jgi:hypothetical protein
VLPDFNGGGLSAPGLFLTNRRGAEDAELMNHEEAKDTKEEGKKEKIGDFIYI